MLRVDVLKFRGVDVNNWIYKVKKFYNLHWVVHHIRLKMVPFCVEGEAYGTTSGPEQKLITFLLCLTLIFEIPYI